jgi:hypothetical protein
MDTLGAKGQERQREDLQGDCWGPVKDERMMA